MKSGIAAYVLFRTHRTHLAHRLSFPSPHNHFFPHSFLTGISMGYKFLAGFCFSARILLDATLGPFRVIKSLCDFMQRGYAAPKKEISI
jgi:hypothetical protein